MGHTFGGGLDLPIFAALNVDSGYYALSEDLTLNGQTVSPTLRYEGHDASVATWTPVIGETLSSFSTGTDPTVGDLTPMTQSGESSVFYQQGKYHRASNGTFADITDDNADVVWECVFQYNRAASESTLFSKYDVSPGGGYLVLVNSSDQLIIYALGAASGGTLVNGAWYHLMGIVDRNGNTRWYINGVAFYNLATVAGTRSNTTPFSIGGYYLGSGKTANSVAFMQMWIGPAGWVGTSADQDAVVKERFAKLTGVYASTASAGTFTPLTMSRTSSAYLDREVGGGVRQLFLVGSNWPRVCKRGGQLGYLSEPAKTNDIPQTENLATTPWGTGNATVAYGYASPEGRNNATALTPNVGAGAKSVEYRYVAGSQYLSVWLKAGINNWVFIRTNASAQGAYFDVANGTIGTLVGAGTNAFIENWGNGWFRCAVGPTGVTGYFDIYTTTADGAFSYTQGAPTGIGTYVYGPMLEATSLYGSPSSYIRTTGVAATRQLDDLSYTITSNYYSPLGTMEADVWIPSGDNQADTYLVQAFKSATFYNRLGSALKKGYYQMLNNGTVEVAASSTTNVNQSASVAIKGTYNTNDYKGYINAAQEVTDVVVAPPTLDTGTIRIGQNGVNALQPIGIVGDVKLWSKIKP